ncbi:MAG: hypothetical protein KDD51_15595 [Bdellovibrionales bacterium]|nr:hypothetical protein [Bdellovibrionales bacterium]
MTRILGFLAIHRLLLFCVALMAIYQALPPEATPAQKSVSALSARFFEEVSERPVTRALVRSASNYPSSFLDALRTPFASVYRGFLNLTHLDRVTALIVLTNLFFFLFLLELYGLWGRQHPAGEAVRAATLVALLPTSFEMSLVSSFSLTCFLVTLAVHRAVTNRWWVTGMALGILVLSDPLNILLVPLLLYLFFYFHQGQVLRTVWKRAVLVLLPVIVAVVVDYGSFSYAWSEVQQSALFYLSQSLSGGVKQTLAHSPWGTTIILITLAIGAVGAFLNNKSFVDKILPAAMLVFVLLTSPFSMVTFRVPLAGICLHGVIQLTGRPAVWILYLVMFIMGALEVAAVFG